MHNIGSDFSVNYQECPENFYCPNDMTTYPLECEAGYKCPKGSANQIPCPSLYTSAQASKDCSPTPLFYVLIILSMLACFVIIIAVIVCIRTSAVAERRAQDKKSSDEEKRRLIPQPDEGPMYSGL